MPPKPSSSSSSSSSSKSNPKTKNLFLKPGSRVEISSNDDGFLGSWFIGTVVRRSSADRYLVRYDTLFEDELGKVPLKEVLHPFQLRPLAPREKKRKFKFGEEVDAFHNDGWWEGTITEARKDGKFEVFFRKSRDQIAFGEEDLRLHREWVDGEWKPPLEVGNGEVEEEVEKGLSKTEVNPIKKVKQEKFEAKELPSIAEVKPSIVVEEEKFEAKEVPSITEVKPMKVATEQNYSKGMEVEVSSDEDGFEGAWFAATIVKPLGKDEYLVQYQSLRTDDDTDFLMEEIDIWHIRPCPPETVVVDRFKLLEEVDALYNDGWWVGVIAKVLADSKYVVYFRASEEEMIFKHSDIRLHQDWIDGKWVMATRALRL